MFSSGFCLFCIAEWNKLTCLFIKIFDSHKVCDREGEKGREWGKQTEKGAIARGSVSPLTCPKFSLKLRAFWIYLFFLLFFASSRCPHFSHVILTALCACVPLHRRVCVCVPEFVGFAFHLLILACISFLYAKCAKCHKFYGQRACKTQKRKATTTVCARRLVGVCVGREGRQKLPQFFLEEEAKSNEIRIRFIFIFMRVFIATTPTPKS